MCQRQGKPVLPPQSVARHIGQLHIPRKAGFQVAQLVFYIHPAARHEVGCHRQVVIGRQVEVVGGGQFKAIGAVYAKQGWQKARFAFFRDGKTKGRHRQYRHALKVQISALGFANFFFIVNVQLGCGQHPFGHPVGAGLATAGGVSALVGSHMVLICKISAQCFAMAFFAAQIVGNVGEKAFKALDIHVQIAAGINAFLAHDAHMVLGLHAVGALVVTHAVGADLRVGALHLRVSFQQHLLVGMAAELVARQVDPGFLAACVQQAGLARCARLCDLGAGGHCQACQCGA